MSIQEVKGGIADFPVIKVTELTSWFAWDKQIEDDLDAGRLDALLAEADKEYEAGLAR